MFFRAHTSWVMVLWVGTGEPSPITEQTLQEKFLSSGSSHPIQNVSSAAAAVALLMHPFLSVPCFASAFLLSRPQIGWSLSSFPPGKPGRLGHHLPEPRTKALDLRSAKSQLYCRSAHQISCCMDWWCLVETVHLTCRILRPCAIACLAEQRGMHSCFAPLCSTTRCVENSSLVVAESLVVLTGYGLCRKSMFRFPGFSILLGLMTQNIFCSGTGRIGIVCWNLCMAF